MKVAQLIEKLKFFSDDTEVMILDGFNGGGIPRTINFGPTQAKITQEEANEAYDCEDRVGEKIVVVGYGCY